jgi:hypothetical protein
MGRFFLFVGVIRLFDFARPLLSPNLLIEASAGANWIIVLRFDRVFVATGWRFLSDSLLGNQRSRFYP